MINWFATKQSQIFLGCMQLWEKLCFSLIQKTCTVWAKSIALVQCAYKMTIVFLSLILKKEKTESDTEDILTNVKWQNLWMWLFCHLSWIFVEIVFFQSFAIYFRTYCNVSVQCAYMDAFTAECLMTNKTAWGFYTTSTQMTQRQSKIRHGSPREASTA